MGPRLARRPGEQDEFGLCVSERSHPACWYNFVLIIVVLNGGNRASPLVCVYMGKKTHLGKRYLSCCKQDTHFEAGYLASLAPV